MRLQANVTHFLSLSFTHSIQYIKHILILFLYILTMILRHLSMAVHPELCSLFLHLHNIPFCEFSIILSPFLYLLKFSPQFFVITKDYYIIHIYIYKYMYLKSIILWCRLFIFKEYLKYFYYGKLKTYKIRDNCTITSHVSSSFSKCGQSHFKYTLAHLPPLPPHSHIIWKQSTDIISFHP